MAGHIVLLWGKPPRPGSLPAQVTEALGRRVSVRSVLPHQERVEVDALAGADLAVHRGLDPSVAPVLTDLGRRGVPLCNPWPAARALADRREVHALLQAGGVPVPALTGFDTWAELLLAVDTEVVVKAAAGAGRGRSVCRGDAATLPDEPPFPGPYVVEPRLEHDGVDRKLYVVGDAVRGLLKASTLESAHETSGEAFEPDDDLRDLALRVGRSLDAHLYGVDVVLTPEGPRVVDAFPGYRGVDDGAAALVAAHLLSHL